MPPIPDIRVNWRGDGFSAVTNDSFVTDTSGWSVASGIQSAGSSITRVTGDGALGGVATNTCASLVTTATNGSGCKYVISGTFVSGRPYRFSVWLKWSSGTTAAKILIGSLGTGADRASTTMTLTGTWTRYSVDWTPSGNRSDVQINITNNAASALTVRICLAEVYEQIDDIGAYGRNEVSEATWTRGANFDGSVESPGQATITARNMTGDYSPDNSSGAYYGLLTTGRPVMVRAVLSNLVYGQFSGQVRRIVLDPVERMAELVCEDWLYDLSRREVALEGSETTSIRDFRGAVLDALGWTSAQRDLATGSPESHIPITGADSESALAVLAECNNATRSIHYVRPHPSPSVGRVYTTIDRTEFQTAAAAETIDDDTSPGITSFDGYDITDENLINSQRVAYEPRQGDPVETVWTSEDVPFYIGNSSSWTGWATLDEPALDMVLDVDGLSIGTPTINFYPYLRTAKIEIITPGLDATEVSAITITGRPVRVYGAGSDLATTGAADRGGADIASDLIEHKATAEGIGDYTVARYGSEKPTPTFGVTNRGSSQVTRDVGDTIAVNYARLSLSAKRFVIRSLTTTVTTAALEWVTDYEVEVAMADTLLFTIGGSASEGVGGTGILAY